MPVMPSKSVLLVEDDELLRECLCEMLSDVGLQVTEAADTVEALERMNIDGVPGVLVQLAGSCDSVPCHVGG